MSDFQSAYQRILEATGLRTQSELAAELGIRQSNISDAKRRNSIPVQWLLSLFDKHALNPAWVRTGEGVPYLAQSTAAKPLYPGTMHPSPRTYTQGHAGGHGTRTGCGTAGGTEHGPVQSRGARSNGIWRRITPSGGAAGQQRAGKASPHTFIREML